MVVLVTFLASLLFFKKSLIFVVTSETTTTAMKVVIVITLVTLASSDFRWVRRWLMRPKLQLGKGACPRNQGLEWFYIFHVSRFSAETVVFSYTLIFNFRLFGPAISSCPPLCLMTITCFHLDEWSVVASRKAFSESLKRCFGPKWEWSLFYSPFKRSCLWRWHARDTSLTSWFSLWLVRLIIDCRSVFVFLWTKSCK